MSWEEVKEALGTLIMLVGYGYIGKMYKELRLTTEELKDLLVSILSGECEDMEHHLIKEKLLAYAQRLEKVAEEIREMASQFSE